MRSRDAGRRLPVRVLMLQQDDPKKCTAARMVRFDLARRIRKPYGNTILLDPFAEAYLMRRDGDAAGSVTAVDCSWRLAVPVFSPGFSGTARKLPPLLAGNPVNYAKWGMLSTAEAVAAALHILGDALTPRDILDKFRWGHTFYDLNGALLDEYSSISSPEQVRDVLARHGYGS